MFSRILILIVAIEVYCTRGIDASPVLQPFTAIQPQLDQMNSLRIHSLAEAAREQASDRPAPKRYGNSSLIIAGATTADTGADLST